LVEQRTENPCVSGSIPLITTIQSSTGSCKNESQQKMSANPSTGSRFNHVMLIDDNEIDNLINSRIMTSHNFAAAVDVKTSTESALDALRAMTADSPNLPSLIFLDLQMPVLDGFAFLEEFGNMSDAVKTNCKIVVLSSSISPDDINRASTNKYVIKYINKPLGEMYLDAIAL
jgi:CheY-like chemotaxis protein